ncbi:hypothetical protein FBY22_1173 [Streptomyces sp. SLBN-31]|nr:hypothetical protein FBY22_1173 [Streptomyces sp. SLBN-31]
MSGQFGVNPATLRESAGKSHREATGLAKPIEGFAAIGRDR